MSVHRNVFENVFGFLDVVFVDGADSDCATEPLSLGEISYYVDGVEHIRVDVAYHLVDLRFAEVVFFVEEYGPVERKSVVLRGPASVDLPDDDL